MTNLASAPAYGRPGVLLTGATGFLGGYLLKELVERTEMPIYCLTVRTVRSARGPGSWTTCISCLVRTPWKRGRLSAIAIVEGDLAKERFGLSEAGYAELAERTGAVFHAAAMLWHFGKLEQFLKVNVQGTENLLAFCSAGMPKTLNHISTLAVSGRRCDNPKNLFTEADFHESMECPNVYVETKYEAEKRLASRHARRARCADFPSGLYYGRFEDGPLQEAHHVRRPVSAPSGAHIHAHGPAAV